MSSERLRITRSKVVNLLGFAVIVFGLVALIFTEWPPRHRRTSVSDGKVTKAFLIMLAFVFGAATVIGFTEPNSPLFPMSNAEGTPSPPPPPHLYLTPRFRPPVCVAEESERTHGPRSHTRVLRPVVVDCCSWHGV
jgi:hypothetical protein